MEHAAAVGVGCRLADLLEDLEEARQVVGRVRPFLEERRQSAALHQLHGEIRPLVRQAAGRVDGDDAGVLELSADLRFFQEALDRTGIFLQVLEKDFDG